MAIARRPKPVFPLVDDARKQALSLFSSNTFVSRTGPAATRRLPVYTLPQIEVGPGSITRPSKLVTAERANQLRLQQLLASQRIQTVNRYSGATQR